MELTPQQEFDCLGCSDRDRNNYVDDIMQTLITYFEAVTCIPWVRSYESLGRPDIQATFEKMGQYGLIEIIASQRIHTKKPKRTDQSGDGSSNDNIICYEVNSERKITVQLNIYREQGEANRDQESNTIVQPVGAGMDVLERIVDMYQIDRLKKKLTDMGIVINEFGLIEWNKELVKNTWENIGEMQFVMTVCARNSIADANIQCIYLKICECEEKLLCEKFEPEC